MGDVATTGIGVQLLLCVIQKSAVNGDVSFSELAKYPYDVLCRKTDLPASVDPSHREVCSVFKLHGSQSMQDGPPHLF